jgi:glycosyltransferase involved in cell wall biosynthesis
LGIVTWAFLTGEYPPQQGGVADYTHQVAAALAELGDTVHVWAPQCAAGVCEEPSGSVIVHRLPGFDGKSLAILETDLERLAKPLRLFVQYVPQAFGWKGMNLPFCLWLSRRKDPVWITFHEVSYPFHWSQAPRHNFLAGVTRAMASILARSAERVYVTIPAWKSLLPKSTRAVWLPVPANCATDVDEREVEAVRQERGLGNSAVIGHFGTYGSLIAPLLRRALLPLLAADPARRILLLGKNGNKFADEFAIAQPEYRGRLVAPGRQSARELSCHLAACDAVVQPYPDGVSSRRGSLMTALALGLPIVTTSGHLTESFWKESEAVVLVPAGREDIMAEEIETILSSRSLLDRLGKNARQLYRDRFALEHTIKALHS